MTIEAVEEAIEAFAEEEEAAEAIEVPASLDFKVLHHQGKVLHQVPSTVTFMANAVTTITNAILKKEAVQDSKTVTGAHHLSNLPAE